MPLQKAAAKERQRLHGGTAPGRKKQSGKLSRSDRGRVRDKIASFAGISGRTLEKIQTIVEAAERQPKRFGQLVAEMDRYGRDRDCNKFRCDIVGTVEAHSRPDRNSPAIFKGGTTSALVQDNIPRKGDLFVLQCKVIRNPDESLSCAHDDGGLEVRE